MINRLMVVFAIVCLFFGLVDLASAGNNSNKRCQNVHGVWVDCSETTINDSSIDIENDLSNRSTNTNTNINTNFNTNSNKAYGGDASAKAYGGDADANVHIGGASVFGDVNTLSPSQDQSQDQDQAQGQLQGQGQKQSQHTKQANKQTMIYNEAKQPVNFNTLAAPSGKQSADLKDHARKSTIRTYSAIFEHDDDEYITMTEAKSAASGSVDIKKAILREASVQLKNLNWKDEPTGVYMGSLTLTTDDATMDQMVAAAAVEAMKLGATGANFLATSAEKLEATKYGLDFGTAASVAVNANGSATLAPGASLGWSKAKSNNREVPELFVELFHDVTLITE